MKPFSNLRPIVIDIMHYFYYKGYDIQVVKDPYFIKTFTAVTL